MNLCKIGLHNWEVLENLALPQLEERVEAKLENRWEMAIVSMGYNYYIKKACLRCGKIVDTITPMMKKIKQKYYDKRNRQELAQKIIG